MGYKKFFTFSCEKIEMSVLQSIEQISLVIILQFEEQKDHVVVEQIMRVIFLDPERPSPVSDVLNFSLPLQSDFYFSASIT